MIRPLTSLAAVAALAACAGGPPGRGDRAEAMQGAAYRPSVVLSGAALLFVQFDADRDLVTTRAETEAGIAAEWARARGGAEALTPIAFSTWSTQALGGPDMGPFRLAFDSNVDNEITRAEFSAAILDKFDAYDANKDGVIRRTDMLERLPEPPRGRGGPPGPPPPGGRPPPR